MNREMLRSLIKVYKCAGCGDILHYERFDEAFCPECQLLWNASLTASCKNCFKPAVECECMSKPLSRAGALCQRRLFFYNSEASRRAPMSIIYWLKYQKSRRIVSFVSRELLPHVKAELDVIGIGADELLVCSVPRSKRSSIRYGYDQSEMVAKSLGEALGVPYVRALKSRRTAKIQKELTQKARMANAKASIRLCRGADVSGKYVILFDDMVTTGASMAASVSELRKNGCKGVLCFSLSSSQKI